MSVIAISPARESAVADGAPLLLRWMIFTGASAFAAVLLWQYGLIHLMVGSDRTYISSIIAVFYLGRPRHIACGVRSRSAAKPMPPAAPRAKLRPAR